MTRRTQRKRPQLAPDWYKDAVIYQLHVKSFFDGNGDGIGDFNGLTAKLDYITSLGADTIWLLPFYPSPRRDDGYDISEYCAVHPEYGSMADVRRFVDQAHLRGLRVITELVINHTSDQHVWFQRARHARKGSAARNYYVWSDTDERYAGTRIIFLDTETSNWTWDPVAGQYYWHRFYSHQPDLNFDNPNVLRAILSVMRFWLDLGIDGLRLDAVPYLIERDGSSNENLPETHEILRRIRTELDRDYPDRMLLAEANQWPEDVQAYFGNGDECHMAFHFPLMPRMYMAIAAEDRFPINDIMRQTPEIPPSCQWAIFLRNHDELTLEMVTDEERDYLWQTYAADRRARLNLGIRRRLAPLMERDRRRIELMTSLLLTLPGTPVLYYGDEIGMGDNIHLGDRDGVRTPMQWSIDRNGGFSIADPAQLVLPPIMDPLFGFQAINVEAQERDVHSLLNWLRRLLAVRARHRTFGRGTLRFLYPGNRKILAFLREHDRETMLCVANLSRTLQAVELELSEYDGAVPVELTGGIAFPPVGRLNYLLTLPPYGFYAFQLVAEAQFPDWHVPLPEPLPDYRTVVLRRDMDVSQVVDEHRQLIEEILPSYLVMRRWYGGKSTVAAPVRIGATFDLRTPRLAEPAPVLTEIETGSGDRYVLPLGIAWKGEASSMHSQQLALARTRLGSRVGYLTDAFTLERLARSMIVAWNEQRTFASALQRLSFVTHPRFAHSALREDAHVRWLGMEQSNSSAVLDDAAVLKLIRRPVAGISPEVEMHRFLARSGYTSTPPLLAEAIRYDDTGTSSVWAVLTGYVGNLGDAWHWTLERLQRALDDNAGELEDQACLDGFDRFAHRIGVRLAELHLACAQADEAEPGFAPVVIDETLARRWRDSILHDALRAMAIVAEASRGDHEGEDAALLQALKQRQAELQQIIVELSGRLSGCLSTRIHGDFHLGQILVLPDDAYLIDFEGEPERSAEERRAKSSPLRDVAGLIRSLDYATEAVARAGEIRRHDDAGRLDRFLAEFRRCAGEAFERGYREVLMSCPTPWLSPKAMSSLLDLFLIEKAAYEIRYEAANRPAWLPVPVRGLLRVLDRIELGQAA